MGNEESAPKSSAGAGIPAPTSNPNIFVELDENDNFLQYWVRPGTIEFEYLLKIHICVRDEEEAARKIGYYIKDKHDFCKETKFVEDMPYVDDDNQSDEEPQFDDDRGSGSSDDGPNIFSGLFGTNNNILPFSNPLPIKDSDADDMFNFRDTGALEESIQIQPVPVTPSTTVRNRINPQPPAPVLEMENRDPMAPEIHYYCHLPSQWSGWMATRFKAFPAMCRMMMVMDYMFDANNRNGFHVDTEKKQRQKAVSEYFTYVDTFILHIDTLFKDINPNAITDYNLRERVIQAMALQNDVKTLREKLHISQPSSKN